MRKNLKILILALVTLVTANAFADSSNFKGHPKPLSAFDVIPLNSPVKGPTAKFLLLTPNGFEIDDVKYMVRNTYRPFDKDNPHQKINLIEGPHGKEFHLSVSKLPPGFYQIFVKVKDKKQKDHEYKNKYRDHVMFVIDESLEVPMPNPKENNKTVAGIDSDNNGIRDDIQRWINEKYADKPRTKMAVKQMASGMHLDLISTSDKAQSIIAGQKVLNDSSCLAYIVGIEEEIKIGRELETKLLNTRDRHYADIKSNANFSGQAIPVPYKDEDMKSSCSFNPDNA